MTARAYIPLAVFLVLAIFLFVGLKLKPREIPSPLIGKTAPQFSLPKLDDPAASLSNADFKGKVVIVNAWASWCVACRSEHHLLGYIAKQGVPIYGINFKDRREDAMSYLAQLGNPYTASGHDLNGKVGIDYGVVATPESFIVDKKGIIRYKVIGPFSEEIWTKTVAPLIEQLNKEPA